MKKKCSYLYVLFAMFLSFFVVGKAQAADYSIELVPYNVTSLCPYEGTAYDSPYDCLYDIVIGDKESYKIDNLVVEPNQEIFIAVKVNVPSNSSLGGFQFVYDYDATKLTLLGSEANDITDNEDGGILPWIKKGSKYNAVWTVSHATSPAAASANSFYITGSNNPGYDKPMTTSGYLYGIWFKVKSDVAPGSSIKFTPETNPAYTDFTDVNNTQVAYELKTLSLSVLSNVSTDGTLSSLDAIGTVSGTDYDYMLDKFVPSSNDPDDLTYSLIVPNSVSSLTFHGTPTNGNTKGTTGLDTPVSLNVGDNTHTISITAESGDITNYVISIRRLSNDARLSAISTTNGVTFPTIVDGTYTYEATVPYKTTSTTSSFTMKDADAYVDSGDGLWNIPTDNNTNKQTTYNVTINAENCLYSTTDVPGNVHTQASYTFKITRTAPSKNVKLSDIKVGLNGATKTTIDGFDPDVHEYWVNKKEAYSINKISIAATVDDSLNTITSDSNIGDNQNVAVGDNTYRIYVLSEDGVTKSEAYVIHLYRKSNENQLQTLTVTSSPQATLSPTFAYNFTGDYTYQYDPNVTSLTLNARVKDTGKAKVSYVDITDPSNPQELVAPTLNTASTTVGNSVKKVKVVVTPEDEATAPLEYIVKLDKKLSSNNYLSALSITPGTINETFAPATSAYTATVDPNVTAVTVNYTLANPNARVVSIEGNSGFDFDTVNTITIKVQSEEGIAAGDNSGINTYTIAVTRKKYDIATLDDLRVGFGSATPTTVTGFSTTPTFDADGKVVYNLYTQASPLDYDTTSLTIEYDKGEEHQTVVGDGTKSIATGANSYTVTVTSHDTLVTRKYVLNVYRQKNTDNSTLGVTVAGVAATVDPSNDKKYNVTLPNSKTTLNPSEVVISIPDGASLTKQTIPLNNLSTAVPPSPVTNVFAYSITSEDGETEYYEIYITREKSNNADISTVWLRLDGETTATRSCTFTGSSRQCSIDVPVNTTGYYLEPVMDPAATVSPAALTKYTMDPTLVSDSSQTRTLNVTAEDGTPKEYTVVVNRAKSSNANLSSITLTNVTNGASDNVPVTPIFNSDRVTYNITVPGDYEDIKIEAVLADSKATLDSDALPYIFTLSTYGVNKYEIKVRAEDGTATKTYTLNITRSKKVDSTLADLKIDNTSVKGATSVPTTYDVGNVLYSKTSLDIDALVNDRLYSDSTLNAIITDVKVNGSAVAITQGENVVTNVPITTGDNEIKITVAAQDRTNTTVYTIKVNRALNEDTGVQSVEVYYDGALHTATWNATKSAYEITVPYNTSLAQINTQNVNGYVKVTPNNPLVATDAPATVTMANRTLYTDDSTYGNVNEHYFTVTAENGTSSNYGIIITRTKNNVKELTRVNLYKNGELTTGTYCVIGSTENSCTISVPVSTSNFRLEGILSSASTNATVEFTDGVTTGTNYTMSGSTKTITATVYAEDGTTATYTINVERVASGNSELGSLKTDANQTAGTLVDVETPFNKGKTEYNLTVETTQSTITVEAIAFDPRSQVTVEGVTIASPTDRTTQTINLGDPDTTTAIKVIVTPEDASTPRTYTINVYRKKNTEPRLSMIYVNNSPINNYLTGVTFDPDVHEYTLNIQPNSVTSLTFKADSVDSTNGTVKVNNQAQGTGVAVELQSKYYGKTLPVAEADEYVNVITITGVAHNDTITQDYVIKVKRQPSSSNSIMSVEMTYGGNTYPATSDGNNRYSITVPNSVDVADSTNVIVTPNPGLLATDALATVGMGSTNLVTTAVNPHVFTVTAEDGTVRNCTLYITRGKASIATLDGIQIYKQDGTGAPIGSFTPSFDKTLPDAQQVYTVVIPRTATDFKIVATPTDPNATVLGASKTTAVTDTVGNKSLTGSSETYYVDVTSEDNSKTIRYTLNVKRESDTNYNLYGLEVTGSDGTNYTSQITPAVAAGVTEYYLTVPGTLSDIKLKVDPEGAGAQVSFDDFTVTADGSTTNVTFGTNSSLNPDGNNATFDAKYDVESNTSMRIKFTVTSESESSQPYYLNLTVSPRTQATLGALSYTLDGSTEVHVLDLVTDPTKRDFVIDQVENNVKKINITASASDSKATVGGNIGTQLIATGDNTYRIVVTAEDGITHEEYTISVNRKLNSDATLKTFYSSVVGFNEIFQPSDPNYLTYTMTVPASKLTFGPADITAIPTVETSVAYPDSELTLTTGSSNVYNVKVQAQDGTELTYSITITRPASDDCFLKSVTLTGATLAPTFSKYETNYTITVPSGSTTFSIASEPNDPRASVSATGNTTHNLSEGSFEITVTAENGDTKVYKFMLAEALSTDSKLVSLSVFAQTLSPTFEPTTYQYSIGDIDNAIDVLTVNATPSNVASRIQYYDDNGTELTDCRDMITCDVPTSVLVDQTKTITVIVTPPANSAYRSTYTISYTKVRSTNAYLSSITPSYGSLTPGFSKGVTSYTLDLPYEQSSVNLRFIAENPNSSISINGDAFGTSPRDMTFSDIPSGGSKQVTVTVKAEDGSSSKTYNVTINRAVDGGSTDAFLSNLYVEDYPFVGETFDTNDFDYTIGQIPFRLGQLTVHATPNDSNARVEYYLDGVKQDSNVINLANTSQTISVKVTPEDRNAEPKYYYITYTKEANTNNNLASLIVSDHTINPAFSSSVQNYTLDVDSATTSIDLTAITEDPSATVRINNQSYVSGRVFTLSNLQPGTNTVSIVVTAENNVSKTYTLVVNKDSESEVITSIEFGHNITNGYIMTVAENVTVSTLKDQLDNDNDKLEMWTSDDSAQLGDTDIVGTSVVVKLRVNGTVVDSKRVIVKGDTDGNGSVDIFDSSDILNHYVGRSTLTGDALIAGDVYEDGVVDIYDSSDVLNHYVGRSLIVFLPPRS